MYKVHLLSRWAVLQKSSHLLDKAISIQPLLRNSHKNLNISNLACFATIKSAPRVSGSSLLQFNSITLSSISSIAKPSSSRLLQLNGVNGVRFYSSDLSKKNKTTAIYIIAASLVMIALSYLAVPLYKIFCQAVGLGGAAVRGHDDSKVETMQPVKDHQITVTFASDTHGGMRWNFHPQQGSITVVPGETALAFYSATNPTDKPIIGISTYNIVPFEAGKYFNKIQVDLPVFFYIDPEFASDPQLGHKLVDNIVLSYTFFEAKEGHSIPLPGFMQQKKPNPA